MGPMNILTRIGPWFAGFLLFMSLVLMAITLGVRQSVGNPESVKKRLDSSTMHELIARQLTSRIGQDIAKAQGSEDQLATIEQAVAKVITVDVVKDGVTQIVDGTYVWLNGKAKTPQFSIDITDIQTDIATSVSAAGVERVKTLTPCTAEQLYTLDPQAMNPYTIPCDPGAYLETIQVQYQEELAAQLGASFGSAQITAPDMATEGGEIAPTILQVTHALAWLAPLAAILAGAVIALSFRDKQRIMRSFARIFIGAAIVLIVCFVSIFIVAGKPTDPIVVQAVASFKNSLLWPIGLFAFGYLVLGASGLFGLRWSNRHHKRPVLEATPPSSTPSTPAEPSVQTPHVATQPAVPTTPVPQDITPPPPQQSTPPTQPAESISPPYPQPDHTDKDEGPQPQ